MSLSTMTVMNEVVHIIPIMNEIVHIIMNRFIRSLVLKD